LVSNKSLMPLSSVSMSTEISRTRLKIEGLDRTTMYQLDRLSSQDPTSFSIEDFLEMSEDPNQEKWFYTVKEEVTVRLANAIMELLSVPRGLSQEITFKMLLQKQLQSFNQIATVKDLKFSDINNQKLAKTLLHIRERQEQLAPDLLAAISEQRTETSDCLTDEAIQSLLDRVYTSKISLDLLISLYNAAHNCDHQALRGLVSRRVDVMKTIREVHHVLRCGDIESADLELIGMNERTPVTEIHISCAPAYLEDTISGVIRNAMEANEAITKQLRRDGKMDLEVPAIKVLVSKSHEDVSVRVSDLGGGIPREQVDSVMQYGVTNTRDNIQMRGRHLAMTRMYARYFQGDLSLCSMHGLGTDVFLYLRALGARECLPKYSVSLRENLNKQNKTKEDWV